MARPTTKSRVLRLIEDFGEDEGNNSSLDLDKVRQTFGPSADAAILDLLAEGELKLVFRGHLDRPVLTYEGF